MLKVAQVGVGGFGRGWLKALVESDLAELVAIVDVSGEALAAARENHGIGESSCFSDLAGALERRSPEAVVCVTPPQFHGSVALEAAGAGLHILTEKPLSGELAAAREMIEAAGEAGVTLMVSQNYRHQPWARSVRRAISDGAVGEIGTVEVRFFKAPHFGGFREEMAYPLVRDMSIHHFDLIRFLTGDDPVAVTAVSWKPGWSWFDGDPAVSAAFELAGGATVTYTGSWVSGGPETSWSGDWRIEGDLGVITSAGDGALLHKDAGSEPLEPVETPRQGLEQSLYEFVQAIDNNTEPATSGRDNIKSLEMVFKAIEAAETGQRAEFAA